MDAILNYQHRGFILTGILVSILLAYLTATIGLAAPMISIVIGPALVFLIVLFRDPLIGLMSLLIYCFCFIIIAREVSEAFPFGYLVEVLYILVFISAIFKTREGDWGRINNDLVFLFSLWFLISVLQLLNPAGASFDGWLSEIRTSGFDSFILVLIGFLVFKRYSHLNLFILVILSCSLLATINGIKQLHIGLFPGEQAFLEFNPTHMIWGQLRVFSFYRDAGQFGASQACFMVISGVLAFGPYNRWKRVAFAILSLIFCYGMLISGTRGSFFALISGCFLAIFLFKNIKVLLTGTFFLIFFVAILKFTYIGSGFSYVHRMRSALDTTDPSLNLRFINQQILGDYIRDYPFGGGLGVLGYAGQKYNADKFLSTIAPDSYWVKVWAMYGIVGLTLWFCMMMYILGKCCGIVWNIQDEKLRNKLIALTAGFFGTFVCSYGNEVINALPSSLVTYLSLVLVFMGPRFDKEIMKHQSNS